jgi:hypothetical protein
MLDGALLLTAAISGICAGLVAIGSTAAVERLGDALGGVLATTPSLMMVTSIGLSSRLAGLQLRSALFTVPCGFLANAFFLLAWRLLPARLPLAWSSTKQLATTCAASIGVWFTGALIVVLGSPAKSADTMSQVVTIGYVCLAALILIGLVVCFRPLPSSSSRPKASLRTHLLRGAGSCTFVFTAVLISRVGDVVAGFASTFPVLFLIAMVSLWLSGRGPLLLVPATGPIILGSAATGAYAVIFSGLVTHGATPQSEPLPAGIDSDAHAMNPVAAGVLSWLLAALSVSLPVYVFLRWRRRASSQGAAITSSTANAEKAESGPADAFGRNVGAASTTEEVQVVPVPACVDVAEEAVRAEAALQQLPPREGNREEAAAGASMQTSDQCGLAADGGVVTIDDRPLR